MGQGLCSGGTGRRDELNAPCSAGHPDRDCPCTSSPARRRDDPRARHKEHCTFPTTQPCVVCPARRPKPITFTSPSRPRSAAKSATNTRSQSAGSIIASSIATATRPHGGRGSGSIRIRLRSASGDGRKLIGPAKPLHARSREVLSRRRSPGRESPAGRAADREPLCQQSPNASGSSGLLDSTRGRRAAGFRYANHIDDANHVHTARIPLGAPNGPRDRTHCVQLNPTRAPSTCSKPSAGRAHANIRTLYRSRDH